jgi:hypothetical protein
MFGLNSKIESLYLLNSVFSKIKLIMKKNNGLLAAIFSVSLVSIGISGLAITTNTHNAFAQSINSSTVKTNSINPGKTHVESMFSTSTTSEVLNDSNNW